MLVDSENNKNIPSHERQALYDLYTSTNGDDWIYQDGDHGHWNFTDPDVNPCSSSDPWQGLNCTVIKLCSDFSSYCDHISEILLSNYNLRGTIPHSIGNFSELYYLNLSTNSLIGSLPTTIGKLISLEIMYLYNNTLTGTIPSSMMNLMQLKSLDLGNNQLSGSIPVWIGNLSSLEHLLFYTNELTGTIPTWIGELNLLTVFTFYSNRLQGTIPSSICKFTSLRGIALGQNYFSGTIPSCVNKLDRIEYLLLEYNMLSGTIPSTLGSLKLMKNLSLCDNLLTGSIPNIFDSFTQLSVLFIQHNLLTGSMPISLADVSSLTELFVHDNSMSGHLINVFNGSHQSILTTVQLSNNQFTGILPEQLFLSRSLQSMSAVSNCFHGTIPSSICMNNQLVSLALDGLVCASSCQTKILPGISSSYVSSRSITGGIPDCLWSMPRLEVLHLSGNKLTGSLPSGDMIISSSLKGLSLSYNHLTGSIPRNIQTKSWTKLDLSHNRLSGTLMSNFTITPSLSLTNNRLSGAIPRRFHDMRYIDILEGSLYDCDYDRSNLPTYDKDKSIYKCGSNTFNVLYYMWLGIITAISMALLMLWIYRKDFTTLFLLIWQWIDTILIMTTDDNNEIVDVLKKKMVSMVFLKRYISTYAIIRRLSLFSTLFIVVILLPIYTILNAFYHTHTYEYAWTVAPMYLSGKTAFGVVIISLVFFVMIQIVAAIGLFKIKSYGKSFLEKMDDNQNGNSSDVKNFWPAFVLYGSVNLIVVGGMNVGYIWVELYGSSSASLLCQILLSLFKLMWNNLASPVFIREMVNALSIREIIQRRMFFFLQFAISILNNIIIPCVVVMIISRNCFYHVFQQESDVTSSFSYLACTTINQEATSCVKFSNVDSNTTYTPPFTYSYQCSSDFITYYSPVFIFFCIISTFLFPFIQVLWIRWKLPNILLFSRVFYPADESEVTIMMHIDQVHKVLVFELTLVGLLMTFGAIFPPLAVVFLLNILVSSYSHQAVIGRFLLATISCERYSHLDILEDNLKVQPLLSTLQKCGWFLLYTACCFYTLFLFDILGDSVGFNEAYWVLIVMPCIPLSLHASSLLIEWIITYRRKSTPTTPIHMDTQIQLSPLVRLDSAKLGRDSSIRDLSIEDRYSQPLKE